VRKKLVLVLLFFLFSNYLCFSEEKISFISDISSKSIFIKDNVVLRLIAEGENVPEKFSIDLELLKDFRIISQKSDLKIEKKQPSGEYRKRIKKFILSPKKSGELIIPSFELRFKGKVYNTNAINILVSDTEEEKEDKKLYIKTFLSKDKAFINEQVLLEFYLLTNMSVRGLEMKEQLTIPGAWIEEFPQAGKRKPEEMNLGSDKAYKYTIKKYALYPRRVGQIKIPHLTFEIVNADEKTFYRKSNPLFLESLVISDSIKPENFQGLIGRFSINSSLDKYNVNRGSPVNLTIVIEGEGNVKAVLAPEIRKSSKYRIYPPKVKMSMRYQTLKIINKKEWTYMIIPEETGIITIPGCCLWFFIPDEDRFRNICSQSYKILSRENTGSEKIKISLGALPSPEINKKFLENWQKPLFINIENIMIILILLPLINLFVYLTGVFNKQRKYLSEKGFSRKPLKVVKKRLDRTLKLKNNDKFVEGVFNTIDDYFYYKYGKKNVLENMKTLRELLLSLSKPKNIIESLSNSIIKLRSLIYSPDKGIEVNKDILIQSIKDDLEKINDKT